MAISQDPTILAKVKSMTDVDAAWHYLDSLDTLTQTEKVEYIRQAPNLKLDKSIIDGINTMPDFPSAWTYMRTNYPDFSPGEMAEYIAASSYGASSSTNTGGNNQGGQGTSITTLLGFPTAAASIVGMSGLKPGSAGITQVGTGILAAIMEYEVFDRAEKAAEKAVTANIALLGALYFGAIGAMMLWLSKMHKMDLTGFDSGSLFWKLKDVIKHGHFSISIHDPAFWYTFAIAAAITSAVLLAGIIAGKPGSEGAPGTPTSSAIMSALSQAPSWYNSIPSAAVGILAAGITVSGTAYSLTPRSIFQQFSIPTVQLTDQIKATGSPNAHILLLPAATKGGYDTVYVVSPGKGGNSTVSMFQVDGNGYLVGANGPNRSYRAFASPSGVDKEGKPSGLTMNQGTFNALYQVPACTAIANDTSMRADRREAALETCLRNNKEVKFIPIGGS